MGRLRRIVFHPIFIFVGIQIAWIILMAVWINWYIKNSRRFKEFAQKIKPELFTTDFNWVILLEGCVLMLIILAGVCLIFVFWNKQARLNRLQSNFVSSVSHELKSPLASIQLYLETLQYQKVSPEETKDFIEIMLTDTERLAGLIENILEAGKSDIKSMRPQFMQTHMEKFLKELLKGYERQFKERECEVRLDIQDSPILNIDMRALRMVFSNLLSNALRYTPEGGPITIRVTTRKKFCVIEFIDSGVGLEKKDLKKVFRKFYRVRDKETQGVEGAGLGLFISRGIVKNHKGKIEVYSEGKGKGSVFAVSLPLADDKERLTKTDS
ncbi:MAG: HAMP domain-containing histidine kinase [Chloroflexi bacterium]|nr:HAMP domain-containing histidine kinase [Chloroflexota bacterium]